MVTVHDLFHDILHQFQANPLYYGHGTQNAEEETYHLLFSILQFPLEITPEVFFKRELTAVEKEKILAVVKRRIGERKPIPYLTNEAYFAGLSFFVDERVIIPRSSVVELIEQEFSPWVSYEKVHRLLDLCTGSGCIAIACAKVFPEAIVDASDVSQEALKVAAVNVARHEVESQVHLFHSDLFDNIPPQKYDMIISNPPYVSAKEMKELPEEYRHEPELALAGGEEGLDLVEKILAKAKNYLSDEGILVVEVGNSDQALQKKYPRLPFVWLEFERSEGGVFLLRKEDLK